MRKIAENVYEHNGKKYRLVKNDNKEKPDCSFCDIGDSGDKCGFRQCKTFHYYKEIKEKDMKKSELSFRVVACSDSRRTTIFRAFKEKGIEFVPHDKMFIYCAGTFASGGNDGEEFDYSVLPELTFADALKLIESIEPFSPEFDIKPFDKVLMRDRVDKRDKRWRPTFATCLVEEYYHVDFLIEPFIQMIKFDGNEKYLGTTDTPPGWWECENGKHVWKTK